MRFKYVFLLWCCVVLLVPAHAVTFTVNKLADTDDGVCDADCSLREAVAVANSTDDEDTIVFAGGLGNEVTSSGRSILLSSNMHIQGPGAGKLTLRRSDGSNPFFYSSFLVNKPMPTITISGLSFRGNGLSTPTAPDNEGGAILNFADMVIRDCIFKNNKARIGGAINNQGKMLIENCTFSENTAFDFGGAIANGLQTTQISEVQIINCTISGNNAPFGGGIFNHSVLSLEHSTITRNVCRSGGSGIDSHPDATTKVSNSIISGNFSDGFIGDVDAFNSQTAFQSEGFNLIGNGTAAPLFNNHDKVGFADPKLAPLADNGGPTPTHALLSVSPAVNAGNPNFVAPPDFDQRGPGFPRVVDNRVDIGAYEAPSFPSVSINDVSLSEGGNTDAVFTISLSKAVNSTVSLNVATANGTAKAPDDYTSTSQTITFAPGETSKTFSVSVKGDLLNETDETFYVLLSSPTNATIGRGRGIGTIVNDDAVPTISIERVIILEGNSGQKVAAFRLTLSAPSGQVVRVNYSTQSLDATPGVDYVEVTSKQVAFNVGSIYAYAPVLINGDEIVEPQEYFNVELSEPQNAFLANSGTQGFIGNDDRYPSLTINDASLTEGNSGTQNVAFTVTLSRPYAETVSVNYATTNGTAVATSDYDMQSGTLTFAAGETTRNISVAVKGDTLAEKNEAFYVLLSGAVNASLSRGRGTATILNDDALPSLSIDDARVVEGNSGQKVALFPLHLSAPAGYKVRVSYATDSNLSARDDDYVPVRGSIVEFNAGSTLAYARVLINGDTLDELDEQFTVSISAQDANIANGVARCTILNDDRPPAISISDMSIEEGNGGARDMVFLVKLSAPSGKTVEVSYATADGTAKSGSDYTSATGTLVLPSGYTTTAVRVPIAGDAIVEPDETLYVLLSNPYNTSIAKARGVGTILNDDASG